MEDIGRRHDDPDLQALGLTFRGLVATRRGSLEEGGLLLDEAMASAVAGELGVVATGVVYCRMLETCLALQDYRRAGEWTDAVDRCSHTTGIGGFPGDCGTHRTAVLVKRGSWTRGDEEGLRAFEDAQRFDLHHAGAASYELGAIRLRQGDLNAAEEAFVRAHDFGSSAQPGMALVQLARGETTAAATSIEDALENPMLDALARAPLLLAKIEVELALGNLESLRDVADEQEAQAPTPASA